MTSPSDVDLEAMRVRRADLGARIAALLAERDTLVRAISEAESRAWVTTNAITPDRVQMSSGGDVPWFGHIRQFVEWLRGQGAPRPYAEWNGRIYLTTDLLNGRMPETPGLAEHVQETRA